MSDDGIDETLRNTWQDHHLSRGERRLLAALAEEPADMRHRMRRRSFVLARDFAKEAELELVLGWLEEVQKALVDPPQAAAAGRSEAHFSPRNEVYRRVVRALEVTRARADIAVFTITDDRISSALLAAHQRGVTLRIVSDNDKAHDVGSDIERLARAGIAVRLDRQPVHMHHKFAVFDQQLLVTGSYNWTRSASDENAENLLVTADADLVAAFSAEFEHCWGRADPY